MRDVHDCIHDRVEARPSVVGRWRSSKSQAAGASTRQLNLSVCLYMLTHGSCWTQQQPQHRQCERRVASVLKLRGKRTTAARTEGRGRTSRARLIYFGKDANGTCSGVWSRLPWLHDCQLLYCLLCCSTCPSAMRNNHHRPGP